MGAVFGGEGSEDEDVEEDDDEPEVDVEEVSLSAIPLMEDRFSSPTLRTPVSSRPATIDVSLGLFCISIICVLP